MRELVRISLFRNLCLDVEGDAATDTVSCRTARRVLFDGTLRGLALTLRDPKVVAHANLSDAQDLVYRFDVTFDRCRNLVWGRRNLTHLQCACQGSEQSTTDGADNVVERGGHVLIRFNAVELLDPTMDAEPNWRIKTFQDHLPNRAINPFDTHSTGMHDLFHNVTPFTDAHATTLMLQSTAMQQSRPFFKLICLLTLLAGGAACGAGPTPEAEPAAVAATKVSPESATPAGILQDEQSPEGVRNYTRVDATVACAGATPPEAMADLRARGFETVVNFRTAEERGATVEAGKAAAEAAGMTYIHLPFRDPTAEVTEAFLEAIGDPTNQPVYIHCGSANRVGAMWLIKRVKVDGWSVRDATDEAEMIGLRSAGLKEFALDYVGAGG